jgi:hypothetical protein
MAKEHMKICSTSLTIKEVLMHFKRLKSYKAYFHIAIKLDIFINVEIKQHKFKQYE